MRIAHLSDLHFGKGDFTGDDNAIIAKVNSYAPHVVIHSGDLTDLGQEQQYKEYVPFATQFKGDLLAVKGNHERVFAPDGDRLFDKYVAPLQKFQDGVFIKEIGDKRHLFATLESSFSYGEKDSGKHDGLVKPEEFSALESRIGNISADTRTLVIHHSLLYTDSCPLINSHDVAEFVGRHRFDHVLSGHTHIQDFAWIARLGKHPFWHLNCGTLRSAYRLSGVPNGFAIYDVEADKLSITQVETTHKDGKTQFSEKKVL